MLCYTKINQNTPQTQCYRVTIEFQVNMIEQPSKVQGLSQCICSVLILGKNTMTSLGQTLAVLK